MNRNTGISLMTFGIVLVVAGAIMRFAVSARASGFNIHTAGIIMLLVGIGVVVLSLLVLALGGKSRDTMQPEVPKTPAGEMRAEREDEPVSQVEIHMPSTQPLTEPPRDEQREE